MAKRRWWFSWMRRLVICEADSKPDIKKPRILRCVFRRLKPRQQPATAVVPTRQETRMLDEAVEQQKKHALNLAIATAAAAEAAVAATKAAAEVVCLAGNAFTSRHCSKKHELNSSAIKIQSAFRAYLARKALRALKALVRIQAIARGRAVRHRVYGSMLQKDNLPTNGVIQRYTERKHWPKPRWEIKEELKVECSSQNSWDCSALTKEDIKAMWLRKHNGTIKRDRMLKYSRSHRERRSPHMLLDSEEMGMRSCRMENWDGSRSAKPINSLLTSTETWLHPQVKMNVLQRQDSIDGQDSPLSFSLRSFSRSVQNLEADGCWVSSSEALPPYMSFTESAKAKVRSRRVGFMDSWFDKKKSGGGRVRLWASYDGEIKNRSSQQFLSGNNTNRHC